MKPLCISMVPATLPGIQLNILQHTELISPAPLRKFRGHLLSADVAQRMHVTLQLVIDFHISLSMLLTTHAGVWL